MFLIWGNWLTGEVQSINSENFLDSVIINNRSIIRRARAPSYELYQNYWHNDAEIQRRYWAASFLLPLGSIFVLALVVLLMVLFKRCPHMVAAIVASILSVIIVFITLTSLNQPPVYT